MNEASLHPLRVLITNRTLGSRTGTEIYVRDLAIALARKGHSPQVYSPVLGPLADEIRAHTVPVTDNLESIAERPDIIHGNHAMDTLTAMLAFEGVPAVSVCHSWIGWADAPLRFPRVIRYVAVDDTCRDRLRFEHAIPDDLIDVVLNSVDVSRFTPRESLPEKPRRALVFSNAAGPGSAHYRAIREACDRAELECEVAGASSGNSIDRPESLLGQFDIVFAKAKAAIEAMSVGTAVVLCDAAGAGPMVTTENVRPLRQLNFGIRALRSPLDPVHLLEQISRYDAADAAGVSRFIRENAALEPMVDQLCRIYSDVIAEYSTSHKNSDGREGQAAAQYLRSVSAQLLEAETLDMAFNSLMRRPLARRLARVAAISPRRRWLKELLAAKKLS